MNSKLSNEDRAIIESILKDTGYTQEDINELSDEDLMVVMGEGEEVPLESMDCSEEQLELLIEYAKLIRASMLESVLKECLPKVYTIEWVNQYGKHSMIDSTDLTYCRRMVNNLREVGFKANYYEKTIHYVISGKELPLQSVYLQERMNKR